MQALAARCQQQCTRRLPGAVQMRPAVSPSPASSSHGRRSTPPTVSAAAAAHGRFFSVCRRTMAVNAKPKVPTIPYATPPPPTSLHKLARPRNPHSGKMPGTSRHREVEPGSEGGSGHGVAPWVDERGSGTSRSSGSSSRTGEAEVEGQDGSTDSIMGRDVAPRPPAYKLRPPQPEIIAPGEIVAFWTTCMWLLRHTAHQFGYRLMPDGFVPLTDMLRYEALAHITPQEFLARIRQDPQDRFEMTVLPEYINGAPQERWWVRARFGHTIPGVSYRSKRILNSSKLLHVVYVGQISEWKTIRNRGLDVREFNDSLIPLSQHKETDVLPGTIPARTTLVCIRIDADEAIKKGVMFFHDNDTRLVSTGNRDGVIPPSLFTGAIELDISKEVLKR